MKKTTVTITRETEEATRGLVASVKKIVRTLISRIKRTSRNK